MSGPHTAEPDALRGDKEWDTALELSLRLQLIAAVWRIKSGRSMSKVEEPIARLGTWLTDVMRLAGHEDAMISPEAEKDTETIRMSLTVNKRKLVVYCSPKGYIEVACSTPGSFDCFEACAQTHQNFQAIMPVEALLSVIDHLKMA